MLDKLVTMFFVVIGLACAILGGVVFAEGVTMFGEAGSSTGSSEGLVADRNQDAFAELAIGSILFVVGCGVIAFPFLGQMLETWEAERRRAAEEAALRAAEAEQTDPTDQETAPETAGNTTPATEQETPEVSQPDDPPKEGT